MPAGDTAPNIPELNVTAGKCDQTPFTGVTVAVENTPLTDVEIVIDSQVDRATEATLKCWKPTGDRATDPPDFDATVSDGTLHFDDLEPQVLTCTIDIDP